VKTTKRVRFLRMTQTNGAGSGGWLQGISEQIVFQQTMQAHICLWDHETFASIAVSLGGQSIFQFYCIKSMLARKGTFFNSQYYKKTQDQQRYGIWFLTKGNWQTIFIPL